MEIRDKILVVEDDNNIATFISAVLEANGYDSIVASNGISAISMITSHCPDLVILDLTLPDIDGMEILSRLRTWSSMPVVVVSARGRERDKVYALDQGADDYITKPFGVLELSARVRAVLRRSAPAEQGKTLTHNDITMDPDKHEVSVSGRRIALTVKEYELLRVLMQSSQRVVSREKLLSEVWGYDYEGESRTLDMHIKTLRAKLGDDVDMPKYIKTVRGVGYMLI